MVAARALTGLLCTMALVFAVGGVWQWITRDVFWNPHVALDERHVERKVAALGRYACQQHRNYANPDYIWNLARTRGINVQREYAEAFEVYRVVA